MKKYSLLFLNVFIFSISAKGQDDSFESILLGSAADAEKIANAYLNPVSKGLIYGSNSGWYHTAKVHKMLGFDLSFGLNFSMAPSEDEMYNLANLGLTTITPANANATEAPTAFGSIDAPNVNVSTTIQGQAVTASFKLPDGALEDIPFNAVPTANLQFNLGLPGKFEVMLRLVPKVGSDKATGELFGLGLKKEITSWFGPLDKLPLHVSLMGAFTNLKSNYGFDNEDQQLELKLNSYTVQAIASLNFPIINVYGGLGYSSGSSTFKMLGSYDLEYQTGNPLAPTLMETVTDPLNLETDASGFRTTVGARLSLGFFKIFADYTLQEYNTFSTGIAFSFL